jgi:hypothetical protein
VKLELPRGLVGAALDWTTPSGEEVVTVVTKATFRLRPDVVDLVEEGGDPLVASDEWVRKPGGSVLKAAELVPGKAQPEMLLVGSAFAPDELPVQSLVVRFTVGKVSKAVEVFGERWWQPDETLGQPTPWLSFPLTYEHAAGGPATWNPIGVAVGTSGDPFTRRRAPSLVPPGASPRSPSAPTPVACFAPLPRSWPLREERAVALAKLKKAQSLDTESELMVHQAAPTDQLLDGLEGDETMILENLCRGTARLVTRLPGVAPRVRAPGLGAAGASALARPDTLLVDTDREIVSIVWRSRHPRRAFSEGRALVVEWERTSRDPALAMAQEAIFAEEDGQTLVTKARPWLREDLPEPLPKRPTQPEMELPKKSDPAPAPVVRLADKPTSPLDPPRSVPRPSPAQERGSSPRSGVRPAPPPVPLRIAWADEARAAELEAPSFRALVAAHRKATPGSRAEPARAGSEALAAFAAVLSGATPVPFDGLAEMGAHLGEGGPTSFVVEGELRFALDDRRVLERTADLAATLGAPAPELTPLFAEARAALGAAFPPARAYLMDLGYRIGRAFAAANPTLPPDLLSTSVREHLLDARAFAERDVLGALHVRAEIASPRGALFAVYLPKLAVRHLPVAFAMPVRALVELEPRQTDNDPGPAALSVIALGVMVRPRSP